MKNYKILVINPGSTSTKVAVFDSELCMLSENIFHPKDQLAAFEYIADQHDFRKTTILTVLGKAGIALQDIDAVIGRGGLLKPIESGVYKVSSALLRDLHQATKGQHASNLGGILANDIAKASGCAEAYIADPPVVDELQDVARISGLPELPNTSIFHALNQKSVSRNYAESIGKRYEDLNLIVAHLGGGITVGTHKNGKVIDVNNGLNGTGPFAPERAGTLPCGDLIDLCFSGKYSPDEMRSKITGKGGIVAHEGTTCIQDVREKADSGDAHAALLLDAMAYNIGKSIGAAATVLHGKVDAVIITGGVAYDEKIVAYISRMISFIAPIVVMPGEDEMKALAQSALNVLLGKVLPKEY